MKRRTVGFAGLALLLSGACSTERRLPPPQAMAPAASSAAVVRNLASLTSAQASVTQMGDSVRLRLESTGLPRGTYGAHIHSIGRCDLPDFTSAGPHWNPMGQQHGKNNPQGMHKGDLPNLLVGTDGRGTLEVTIPGARLSGDAASLLDADGAAIVIHERPDDYRTDPSGNSGGRIACGVFG